MEPSTCMKMFLSAHCRWQNLVRLSNDSGRHQELVAHLFWYKKTMARWTVPGLHWLARGLRAGSGLGDGSDSSCSLAQTHWQNSVHERIWPHPHLPGKHLRGQGLLLRAGIKGRATPIPGPPDGTRKNIVHIFLGRGRLAFITARGSVIQEI